MTQYYIVGELSLLLTQLEAAAPNQDSRDELERLRRVAERRSPAGLGLVVLHSMRMADGLCVASLERGDENAFARQVSLACELASFAACAGLLDDDSG